MNFHKMLELFKSRCNTIHTFTRTKTGRKFLVTALAVFILLFVAPLFHGSVGAALLGCVGAPMTILLWRRFDNKHAIVPAVFFCIVMILDMLIYMTLVTATCLLVSAACTFVVAMHPAFLYIRTIKDNMYAALYAGCVCAGIVILASLAILLVSIAWWIFCLLLFVIAVGVFFSVVLSTAAYTATDAKRQARKKELREYDLEETTYDFDIFAQDLGIKRDSSLRHIDNSHKRRKRTSDNDLFYDVDE